MVASHLHRRRPSKAKLFPAWQADFRIFDNGTAQNISYFDASSSRPASPGDRRKPQRLARLGRDARKRPMHLWDALAPLDQAAVIDFSAHTYLQLPFSDVRELIRQAVARVDARASA